MDAIRLARLVALAALPVCLLAGSAAAVAVDQEPVGYYFLTSAKSSAALSDSLLTDGNLAGALLRRDWSDVNPAPGQYNWAWLDAAIAQLQTAGKKAQIAVDAGVNAPAWVYTLGAQSLSFTDPRYPGQNFSMPVPWDPVMLAQWDLFVQALGARYDGDATVTAVHMGGPTEFSVEMYVPAQATQLPGFSNAALTAAWTQVIGAYSTAFPNTAVVLDMSNPTSQDDGIAASVAAAAVTALGSRATLQHDSLHATTSSSYSIQVLLLQYAQQGVRVGFEMVSASDDATRFGGPFADAVTIGRQSGARYLNIYSNDTVNITAPFKPAVDQNAANPVDVNGDGMVSPIDALFIINYLNANGPAFLPPPVGVSAAPFYDVNGDGILSALDALIVINALNAGL